MRLKITETKNTCRKLPGSGPILVGKPLKFLSHLGRPHTQKNWSALEPHKIHINSVRQVVWFFGVSWHVKRWLHNKIPQIWGESQHYKWMEVNGPAIFNIPQNPRNIRCWSSMFVRHSQQFMKSMAILRLPEFPWVKAIFKLCDCSRFTLVLMDSLSANQCLKKEIASKVQRLVFNMKQLKQIIKN